MLTLGVPRPHFLDQILSSFYFLLDKRASFVCYMQWF